MSCDVCFGKYYDIQIKPGDSFLYFRQMKYKKEIETEYCIQRCAEIIAR